MGESVKLIMPPTKMAARVVVVMWLVNLYFAVVEARYVREGVLVGAVWAMIALFPRLLGLGPLLSSADIGRLTSYVVDAAEAFLWIPVVTVGVGMLLERRSEEAGPPSGR